MTETVLWETHRCRERGGFVERLFAVDDGVRYEREGGPADEDDEDDLVYDVGRDESYRKMIGDRREVFPDVEAALEAQPGLLDLFEDDRVTECRLPTRLLVERLRLCQDNIEQGWYDPITLADREWDWNGWLAKPCDVSPVASWSNGDRYDRPGGDYWSNLYAFGSLYVLEGADEPAEIIGHFPNETVAVARWLDSMPIDAASLRTYLPRLDLRDDVDLEEVMADVPEPIALGHGLDAIYDFDELDEWWGWAARPEWSADPAVWIPAHVGLGSFEGPPLAAITFDSGDWAWLHRVGDHYVHGGSGFDGPQYLGRSDMTFSAYRRWWAVAIRPRTHEQPRLNLAEWVGLPPGFEDGEIFMIGPED